MTPPTAPHPPSPLSAGAVRASSLFPILSVGLLFLGGMCVAASEFYKSRYNVILTAGILFVSAGQKHTHTHTRLMCTQVFPALIAQLTLLVSSRSQ